ncbi:MAG TPA: hypothetical protein PLD02_09435 [Saprospiraceae bacterium]|nr:hypothetical protein [Saprospiraceae bacterium]
MTQLSNVQQNTVTLVIKDLNGNVHGIDGVPVWLVEDPSILTLNVAPDGLSATFVTTGVVGVTRVNVIADVDTGSNVLNQTGTFEVTVTESGEVIFEFTFGTPTHR